MPLGDSGTTGTPLNRLKLAIDRWEKQRRRIRTLNEMKKAQNGILGPPFDAELAVLQGNRRQTVQRINTIVGNHPNLRDNARRLGFRMSLLTGAAAGARGGGDDTAGGGTRPGSRTTTTTKNKPPPKDTDVAKGSRILPGKRGKHYRLYRDQGDVVAVYFERMPNGRIVEVSVDLTARDVKAMNIKVGSLRRYTQKHANRVHHMGTTRDLALSGGNKFPVHKFLKELYERNEGASFLRNKEVVALYIEQVMEGHDSEWLKDRIAQTKWWNKRTAYQRQWELVLSDKDKKKQLVTWRGSLEDGIREMFGGIRWQDHIGKDQLKRWTGYVAAGRGGNPSDGFEEIMRRVRKMAEKIEGTNAYVERQEEINRVPNTIADMEEALRQDMKEWLGPRFVGDNAFINKWAEDIVYGRKTRDAHWVQHLRTQKKALHKWLDDDETWRSGMASYRALAEDIYGVTLEEDDPLFSSFTATDQTGQPIGGGTSRMTGWDFERKVRSDPRYMGTKDFRDQNASVISGLDQMFNGGM